MMRIKQLRINSIPGIFNRLSATPASQTLVVNQLLEKIVAASKEAPEVLRYTLCKIAAQLVAQAQSEFFIIEDESQSIPVTDLSCYLSCCFTILYSFFYSLIYLVLRVFASLIILHRVIFAMISFCCCQMR